MWLRSWLWLVALTVFMAACGRVGFDATMPALGDGTARDAMPDAVPLGPFGPFAAPVEQTAVNSAVREFDPTISADGLELYVGSFRTGGAGDADLYRSIRVDRTSPFLAATAVVSVDTVAPESAPALSNDGLTLAFFRGTAPATLYEATRATTQSAAWSNGVVAGATASALLGLTAFDFGPGDLSVVADDGSGNLYEATRTSTSAAWSAPELLAGLGVGPGDDGPSLRGDGLEIFWTSRRTGTLGIYHAFRTSIDQPFGVAERVELGFDMVDSADPDITADGRVLVFVTVGGSTGEYDVFLATRAPL